jgi:hypothetical protein
MTVPAWNLEHFAIGEVNKMLDRLYRTNYIQKLRLLHSNCCWVVTEKDSYGELYDYWGDFTFTCSANQIEEHHTRCQSVHDDESPRHEDELKLFLEEGNTLESVNRPSWDAYYLVNTSEHSKESNQTWVKDLLTVFEQCTKCGSFRSIRTQACANCVDMGLVVNA